MVSLLVFICCELHLLIYICQVPCMRHVSASARLGEHCKKTDVVYMRSVPVKFMYLNIWSPFGGTVWRAYGIFRRWSLLNGSTSLKVKFYEFLRFYSLAPFPAYSFSLIPVCR